MESGEDKRPEYDILEQVARHGVLFQAPIRLRSHSIQLTQAELDDREKDNKKCDQICEALQAKIQARPLKLLLFEKEELVALRVLPCKLKFGHLASRRETQKSERKRAYPLHLEAWVGFNELVEAYEYAGKLELPVTNPGYLCLQLPVCRDESDEFGWLKNVVVSKLVPPGKESEARVGNPDACYGKIEEGKATWPAVVVEAKSTQNLLLPETAVDIQEDYYSNWWTYHPIGQVACYMANNKCQYGVLTSGTRTYFMHASRDGKDVRFFISRRWYVAEKHYLRAWSYVLSKAAESKPNDMFQNCEGSWVELSDENSNVRVSLSSPTRALQQRNSIRESTEPVAKRTRNAYQRSRSHPSAPWEDDNLYGLPEVSHKDITPLWLKPIGYGRNGFVVRGVWIQKRTKRIVALKQFDLDKDGGPNFDCELKAYVELKSLQGIAVPQLLFVSRSWCGRLRFMGLQLGQAVKGDEPWLEKRIEQVHAKLKVAGWRQPEEEKKLENHVWLKGDRLAVVDLEMLERI